MKKTIATLALGMILAGQALATPEKPLIVKSNYPGFVHPDWFQSESCALFADRLEITHQYGAGEHAVVTVETRNVSISPEVNDAIAQASEASVTETDNGLCDGPSSSIVANLKKADGSYEEVSIFTTGGCGSPRRERDGVKASHLKNIILNFCPNLHDFSL